MSWIDYGINGHLTPNSPFFLNHKLALIDAIIERYSVTSLSLNPADITKYKNQEYITSEFLTWIQTVITNIVVKYIKNTSFMTFYNISDFAIPSKGWNCEVMYADYFNKIYDILNLLIYIDDEVNPSKTYIHNTLIDKDASYNFTESLEVVNSGYPANNVYTKIDYPVSDVFDDYFAANFTPSSEIVDDEFEIMRLTGEKIYTESYLVWGKLDYYLYFNNVQRFGYGFLPKNTDLDYEVNLKYTFGTTPSSEIFVNETVQYLYTSGSVIQPSIINSRMLSKINTSITQADLHNRCGDMFFEFGYDYQTGKMIFYSGVDPFGFKNYYLTKPYKIFIKPDFDFHA